jgi:uncharacterized membrane protein YphA (DoxX/SURF4 family)
MSARPLPPSIGLVARLIVGGALVYAGAIKAAGPAEEFALVIGAYQVLPPDMALTLATFLPWAEMLIGWALLLGFQLRVAGISACALFGGFLFALATVVLRGIQLPNCGCFGDAVHFTPAQAFLVDAVLTGLSYVTWKAPAALSLDNWTQGGYTKAHAQR